MSRTKVYDIRICKLERDRDAAFANQNWMRYRIITEQLAKLMQENEAEKELSF